MASPHGTSRLGEGSACPHCGAKAGAAPDEGGYLCLVCGGPVVLVEGDVPRARGERAHLERAKALRARRAAWAVAGSVIGGFAVVAGAVALAVAALVDLGAFAGVALAAMVLMPFILSIAGWRKAKADSREAAEALAEAQRIVAAELLSASPGTTAAELSRRLHVTEDAALELMAHAQVGGLLTSPPDIKYRVDKMVEDTTELEGSRSAEEARKMSRRSS